MKNKIRNIHQLKRDIPNKELEKLPVFYLFAEKVKPDFYSLSKSDVYRSGAIRCHAFHKPISRIIENLDEDTK